MPQGAEPGTAGTSFLYNGANAIHELSGSTTTANLIGGGIDKIFTRADATGTFTPLQDALGSTIALVDANGNQTTQYSYDPFGNTTVFGATNANGFQYTGRENDGNGLYYYRRRYYSPLLHRFISQDPIGFRGGDLNLYAYVGNDPIDSNDPTGMCKVQVGHHTVVPGFFWVPPIPWPAVEVPPAQHTYIVVGAGRYDKEKFPTAFDSAPSEDLYPWNDPKLEGAVAWLTPGSDEAEHIKNDELVTIAEDDGRTCGQDIKILNNFAYELNASRIPYGLTSTNSNAAASEALGRLGFGSWNPSFLAPGWGTPLKIKPLGLR